MIAGNWVPELVDIAGGINLCGQTGKHSSKINIVDLLEEDPDVIVVMPCGFNIEKTRKEMDLLVLDENWKKLKAVKGGRVYLTDGNQYFNRPGPRLVESIEILAEIFHPTIFNYNHKDFAWESLRTGSTSQAGGRQ